MKFPKERFREGSNIFKLTAGTLFWWEVPEVNSGTDPQNRSLADHPRAFVGFRLARVRRNDDDKTQK